MAVSGVVELAEASYGDNLHTGIGESSRRTARRGQDGALDTGSTHYAEELDETLGGAAIGAGWMEIENAQRREP
jgi:hypothetical protein